MKRVVGDVMFQRFNDTSVCISRADPRTLISAEMLRRAVEEPTPYVVVTFGTPTVVVVSDDFGQSFTYRITDYHPEFGAYEMEWPD